MRPNPPQRVLWGAVAALLLLLVLLATLQYRWIGRLSEIEGERMRASVELSTQRFAADFNEEATRAFAHFLRGVFRSGAFEHRRLGVAHRPGDDFERRAIRLFGEWRQEATYPDLWPGLFWLPEGREGRVLRYDGDGGFQESAEGVTIDVQPGFGFRDSAPSLPYSERAGGLVIPIPDPAGALDLDAPGFGGGWSAQPGGGTTGYLVLRLDRDALLESVLPELGRVHFAGLASGGRDEGRDDGRFDFAVLDRRTGAPIFVSRPGLDPQSWSSGGRAPDSEEPLMRMLAAGEGRSLRRGAAGDRRHAPRFAPHRESSGSRAFGVGRAEPERGPADESAPWLLVVRHSEGSLAAAVGHARHRNLAVGSGVLLLLAAAVGTLFVATRRSAELARQQLDFVAGVSHELRTPLAALQSLGENLADGIVRSDEQVRRYGGQIKRQTGRLGELVDQVLQFAGGLSGRNAAGGRPIEVRSLIEGALEDCRVLVAERSGSVRVECEPVLPRVGGDPEALRGAIRNLLSNALKYGGRAPKVTVAAAAVGDRVRIAVSDSGPGIDPAERDRVFEPFYRSPAVRDEQIEGTGLGLSLVRSIVEAQGGTVTYEAPARGGSRFTISLPSFAEGDGDGGVPASGASDGANPELDS